MNMKPSFNYFRSLGESAAINRVNRDDFIQSLAFEMPVPDEIENAIEAYEQTESKTPCSIA